MGKMNIVLPDDLEKKFRKAVFEKKGMKKGNISEALEEAVNGWIKTESQKLVEEKRDGQ
jgi:hypothetical protein